MKVWQNVSLPREVSGQYSIIKDKDSAHLADCQIAHSRHHGIPVCEEIKAAKYCGD